MSVTIPDKLKDLNTQISMEFARGLTNAAKEYAQVSRTINSTSSTNTYDWLSAFPQMTKTPSGSEVAKANMAKKVYQLINDQYDVIVPIDMNQIKDGLVNPQDVADSAVNSAIIFFNQQVGSLIKNGYTNLCYDGQNFFDTDHPIHPNVDGTGTAATFSNIIGDTAASGSQWVVADFNPFRNPFVTQNRENVSFVSVTDPEAYDTLHYNTYEYKLSWRGAFGYGLPQMAVSSKDTLNAANLKTAITAIRDAKIDGNIKLYANPTHLIVPTSLEFTAKEILASIKSSGATNELANYLQVVVVRDLV